MFNFYDIADVSECSRVHTEVALIQMIFVGEEG